MDKHLSLGMWAGRLGCLVLSAAHARVVPYCTRRFGETHGAGACLSAIHAR